MNKDKNLTSQKVCKQEESEMKSKCWEKNPTSPEFFTLQNYPSKLKEIKTLRQQKLRHLSPVDLPLQEMFKEVL